MKPVRILVDSTVDLPERCRAQVRAVPLTVHFGDEELIDGVTIEAGANAITYTPPSTYELFQEMMKGYRE